MRRNPTDLPLTIDTPSQRLTRRERLRGRTQIRHAFRMPKRQVATEGARLLVVDNGLGHNRLLVTARRGFGSAVARNRARRQFRETYRRMKHGIAVGHDLVFLVYPGSRDGAATRRQIRALLGQAGLIRTDSLA
jgi:ribonuclease P protein component